MTFKAYGTFIKKDGFIYRTDTYLQFGESEKIIGACVLCNPGSSSFMDENEEEKLVGYVGEDKYERKGELVPDDTMKQLKVILEDACRKELEGKFLIFNTFTIRNSNMSEAKKLLKDESVDEDLLYMDYKKYKEENSNIPYILIGWGCEEYKILKDKKNEWLDFIKDKDITYIGVEGKKPPHYYHPLPRINEKREEYREAINEQFNGLPKEVFTCIR